MRIQFIDYNNTKCKQDSIHMCADTAMRNGSCYFRSSTPQCIYSERERKSSNNKNVPFCGATYLNAYILLVAREDGTRSRERDSSTQVKWNSMEKHMGVMRREKETRKMIQPIPVRLTFLCHRAQHLCGNTEREAEGERHSMSRTISIVFCLNIHFFCSLFEHCCLWHETRMQRQQQQRKSENWCETIINNMHKGNVCIHKSWHCAPLQCVFCFCYSFSFGRKPIAMTSRRSARWKK